MNTDYSVVLAVKNAEEYLQKALVSVYCQSLAPKEVIVVEGMMTSKDAGFCL